MTMAAAAATLQLTPLSREECRGRLLQRGVTTLSDVKEPVSETQEQFDLRRPLTLKLCQSADDVVDLEGDADEAAGNSGATGTVHYALRYTDGSVAARATLGRNVATGIRARAVSRALADVSLARALPGTPGGGAKAPVAVDLTSSPQDGGVASAAEGKDGGDQSRKRPPSPDVSGGEVAAAAHLTMRKPAGAHRVHVDGKLVKTAVGRAVPLSHGAIVSLDGQIGFAYEVSLAQSDEGEKPPATERSPKKLKAEEPKEEVPIKERPPSPRHQAWKRARDQMVDECMCAMCMDVIVRATIAYPCSHVFCEKCSLQIASAGSESPADVNSADLVPGGTSGGGVCPTCRGLVRAWMPARVLDSMISSIALQGCFERDDAEHYLERREKLYGETVEEHEKELILNGRGGEEGTAGVAVAAAAYLPPDPSLKSNPTFIRTLPPLFPSAMDGIPKDATNHNSDLDQKPRAKPNQGKSTKNDVICID